jgi:hypothetical protein
MSLAPGRRLAEHAGGLFDGQASGNALAESL